MGGVVCSAKSRKHTMARCSSTWEEEEEEEEEMVPWGSLETKTKQQLICEKLISMSCTLVVPILMIVYGGKHLDNKTCDSLDDGVGIAQWLFISGIYSICSMIYTWIVLLMSHDTNEGVQSPCPTVTAVIQLLLLVFNICWTIYGAVVTFEDHPDDSHCPNEVHVFAFVVVIIQLVVYSCFCCCVTAVLVPALIATGMNGFGAASNVMQRIPG